MIEKVITIVGAVVASVLIWFVLLVCREFGNFLEDIFGEEENEEWQ